MSLTASGPRNLLFATCWPGTQEVQRGALSWVSEAEATRAQSHLLSAMKGSQAPEMALRSAAGPAVALSQLPRPAVEPAEDAPIPRGASALLSSSVCQEACPGAVSSTFHQGGSPGVPSRKQALVRSAVYGSSWVQLDRGGWEDLKAEGLVVSRLWGRNWTSIRTQELTGWASSQRGGWLSE